MSAPTKALASAAIAAATLVGCASTSGPDVPPQTAFFASLQARCGQAFAGKIETNQAPDADMQGKDMVMHIRSCSPDRIEIPFHIAGLGPEGGWDRSRTWVITRTETGLRLKHDHRHADGTSDKVSLYGGDTATEGSANRQEFPVDAESIAMFKANGLTASVTNIWAVESDALGFAYELRREGRHFRVGFSWDQPVTPPPAPWGW